MSAPRTAAAASAVPRSRGISTSALILAAAVAAPAVLGSAGCHKLRARLMGGKAAETAKVPTPAPTPVGPTPPKIDYAAVRPNELGRIPVIMYHEIQPDDATRKKPLSRSVSDFKKDLELMYAAGFRPVNLSDVIDDKIDVPAGKSPIVLTFDDARPSQFQLIETPNSMQIDPNCAVGILDAFHKEHSDWPMKATFFVLPKSKATLEPFGQIGLGATKMQYLLDNGMEIGNHTTLHLNMHSMAPPQIQQEIGYANQAILEAVPKANIETMAVPMGKFPKKEYQGYLMKGTYQGKPYAFKAVMAAAWRPIPSPDSKEWNPAHLERIDGTQNGLNGVRDWIDKLSKTGGMYQKYVSDGDPNVISFPKGDDSLVNVQKVKAEGKLLNPYSPFGGPGGAKPIVSAPITAAPATGGEAVPANAGGGVTADETTASAPAAAKPIVGAGGAPAGGPAPAADTAAPAGAAPVAPAPGATAAPAAAKPITSGQ